MPMPSPSRGESRDAFVDRCMGDGAMISEFPDTDQRMAVCMRQLEASASPGVAGGAYAPLAIEATATIDVEAADGGGGGGDGAPRLPRFTMLANTGAVPMRLKGWKFPVIVDLAGLAIPSQSRPVRFGHDEMRGVGHTTEIIVRDGNLVASGVISRDTPESRDVVSSAKNGFPWQASIGASADDVEFVKAGDAAIVNGREFAGPINVARKSTLNEISFVDLGADQQTSASVAASDSLASSNPEETDMNFDQWVKAKGFDPTALDETQKSSLRAMFDAEQARTAASNAGNGTTVAASHAGNGTATVTTAATSSQVDAGSTRRLEDIFAAQRAENERIEEITRITAQAIQDRPGMIDALERMSRTAIEARVAPRDYELEILRALRATPVSPRGGPAIHAGDAKATATVIEAALCKASGLAEIEESYDARTLEAADARFKHGLGLCEVLMIAARENGYAGHSARDVEGLLRAAFPSRSIQASTGFSTISLPGIMSNVANKFLVGGFNSVEDTWRAISSRRSVPDFKAITSYALTGGFTYLEVGPGGELKHATVSELEYTNRARTYGRIFAVTREHIINDDAGAFTQIPRKLGRGAALGLNRDFWTAFMNNASFFASGNNNYFEGAATNLQLSSLTTAETMFMNQTDPDGDPVAIMPKILLVPNALSVTAANIMNSTQIAGDTTANTVTLTNNPHAGKFRVVSSSYLSNANITGYSTTKWYLLADPNDLATIEVAFLNGRERPTVESADADFNTLGIQFRGYFDYGVALQESRAGVASKGAA